MTPEKGRRGQIGSSGKGALSFIEKCPDSCISNTMKINFLKEISFKKFLPCLFHRLVWRMELQVRRGCVIPFLVDRAFFFYPCDSMRLGLNETLRDGL